MLWQRYVGTQGLGVPPFLQQPRGANSLRSHGRAGGRNEPQSCVGPSPMAAVSVADKGARDMSMGCGAQPRVPRCSFWGSVELCGHPRDRFRGAVLSLEPGISVSVRSGMGVREGGMLRRKGHGAPCTDLASAVPWREQGLLGGTLHRAEPPSPKFSSPKPLIPAARGCIQRPAVPGSSATVQLVQAAGLEPGGSIQPQPPCPPSQPQHLCKAMALPSQILLQPPSLWRGEAWGRLLCVPMFWGMRGSVWPSSHQGRR